jgi:protein-tyrosine-phosphatase
MRIATAPRWPFLLFTMSIRRFPERLLHSRRRAAATRRVIERVTPGPVLFLCHGNICRSPFAEVRFAAEMAALPGKPYPAESAGFIGPNRGSPPAALAAAARVGVNLSAHRSRLVTADMVYQSKLVVVMSADQAAGLRSRFGEQAPPILILGDLDPLPIEARTIKDPWNCDESVFDDSYARIDRCVHALVRLLTETQPAPQQEDNP